MKAMMLVCLFSPNVINAAEVTCFDVKKLYKDTSCCGLPDKTVSVPPSWASKSSTVPLVSYIRNESLVLMDRIFLDYEGIRAAVQVLGYRSVPSTSSQCGLVLRIMTPHGTLYVDGTKVTASVEMKSFLNLATGATIHAFVDSTVGATDECNAPVSKGPPESTLSNYKATISVTTYLKDQSAAYSKFFTDDQSDPVLLPGVIEKGGLFYQTFTEKTIQASGLSAKKTLFGMTPYSVPIRVTDQDSAVLDVLGYYSTNDDISSPLLGTRCTVGMGKQASLEGGLDNTGKGLNWTFAGTVEEDGLVLRKFTHDPTVDLASEMSDGISKGEDAISALMHTGKVPNFVEYYDVDVDPTGNRPSGSPYKILHMTTVKNVTLAERKWMTFEAFTSDKTVAGVLGDLGISALEDACRPKMNQADGLPAGLQTGSFIDQMISASSAVSTNDKTDILKTRPAQPSTLEDWTSIQTYLPKLRNASKSLAHNQAVDSWIGTSVVSNYWRRALSVKPDPDHSHNVTGHYYGSRRLGAKKLAPARRLSACDWAFEIGGGPKTIGGAASNMCSAVTVDTWGFDISMCKPLAATLALNLEWFVTTTGSCNANAGALYSISGTVAGPAWELVPDLLVATLAGSIGYSQRTGANINAATNKGVVFGNESSGGSSGTIDGGITWELALDLDITTLSISLTLAASLVDTTAGVLLYDIEATLTVGSTNYNAGVTLQFIPTTLGKLNQWMIVGNLNYEYWLGWSHTDAVQLFNYTVGTAGAAPMP